MISNEELRENDELQEAQEKSIDEARIDDDHEDEVEDVEEKVEATEKDLQDLHEFNAKYSINSGVKQKPELREKKIIKVAVLSNRKFFNC